MPQRKQLVVKLSSARPMNGRLNDTLDRCNQWRSFHGVGVEHKSGHVPHKVKDRHGSAE